MRYGGKSCLLITHQQSCAASPCQSTAKAELRLLLPVALLSVSHCDEHAAQL